MIHYTFDHYITFIRKTYTLVLKDIYSNSIRPKLNFVTSYYKIKTREEYLLILALSEVMNMEHPSTRSMPSRSSFDTGFIRRLTWTVVSVFVILMAVIGIAWFVMHPHDPSFAVTSRSVSNFTVSDSQITGMYEVRLTVTNPNKKIQLILDDFNVVILYSEVVLSIAEVQQPILLVKMSNMSVNVDLVMKSSVKLVQENLVKEWNKGVVNFDVKMVFRLRFEAGIWPSKEKILCVYCDDLDVKFYSPKETGKLLGIGKNCHIVDAKPYS
jgi:hypothetical protein